MTFRNPMNPRRAPGFTMIELLVAMALAITMLLMITMVFAGTKQSFRLQDGLTRVQEDGRVAVNLLSEHVRLAGFRKPVWNDPMNGYQPLTSGSVNGDGTGNDTLQLMYMDSASCTGAVSTTIDPETREAIANYKRITFFVDDATQLRMNCEYGTDPLNLATQVQGQIIVDGVESFQVQYGVDTDFPPDFSVNAWTDASSIRPETTVCLQSRYLCEGAGLVNDMLQGVPVAVKVGLLLSSPDVASAETTSESFAVLDVTVNSPDDQRVRKAFLSTVALRNLTL